MKCIDPREIQFLRNRRLRVEPSSLSKNNTSSRYRSGEYYNVLDLDQFDQARVDYVRQSMRRSIKEFSHFDWTRVRLLEDDYLDDQLKNVNIFSQKSPNETVKLPAIESSNINVVAGHQQDSTDKFKSFSGPQVITIRLS